MVDTSRRFSLGIWALALGYFTFYLPYIALIKIIILGLWPGGRQPASGFELLPSAIIATAIVMPLIITLLGWWKYAGRREFFGLRVPLPGRWLFLSGVGTALIIGTTTLAYTFKGVSIILALVVLRAGVLTLAPLVDIVFKRKVRWFSWVALGLSVTALVVGFADVGNYKLSSTFVLIVIAYLTGYILRLPCMTVLAKSRDEDARRRYFVEEQMVAMCLLVAVPAVLALIGKGQIMLDLRHGFTTFFGNGLIVPALLVGVCYACLCVFGTLMYLDCRENTFCVPLNRCASILSGVVASYALTFFLNQPPPSVFQLAAAGLILMALLFLSPLHHFDLYLGKLKNTGAALRLKSTGFITRARRLAPVSSIQTAQTASAAATHAVSAQDDIDKLRRLFLFVCSGNTCRSPMAEVIGQSEIAARLNLPFEAIGQSHVQAISAGLSVRPGAPMTPEAQQALQHLGLPVISHQARALTVEMIHQAEMILCMTHVHRQAVIAMTPAVEEKAHCLDPNGDIEDPLGLGFDTYIRCGQRIQGLIRQRLDEAGI